VGFRKGGRLTKQSKQNVGKKAARGGRRWGEKKRHNGRKNTQAVAGQKLDLNPEKKGAVILG